MSTENYFNGYLCITKEEEIASLPIGKDFKALVLESNVFPGYYSSQNFPITSKPISEKFLYLIIKGQTHCFQDKIIRKLQKVKTLLNVELNACPGEIKVYNKMSSCVRITNVDFDLLKQVINLLKQNGVEFHQHKTIKPYFGFIHIKKWVELKQLFDGILQNTGSPNEYFVEIPRQIEEWSDFTKITTKVKNNCGTMSFDAAQGAILQKCALKDYVRIFSSTFEIEKLPELKEYYQKEISRYFA